MYICMTSATTHCEDSLPQQQGVQQQGAKRTRHEIRHPDLHKRTNSSTLCHSPLQLLLMLNPHSRARSIRVALTACCSCPPPSSPSSRSDNNANPHRRKHRSPSAHRGEPAGARCLGWWIRPARRPEAPRSLLLLQLLGGAATWKPTTQGPTIVRTEHATITVLHGCLALLDSAAGMVGRGVLSLLEFALACSGRAGAPWCRRRYGGTQDRKIFRRISAGHETASRASARDRAESEGKANRGEHF